jgi:hypothetical protein
MSNIIYAICGKKTHGKDTLAERIKLCDSEFIIEHFADDLKKTCSVIFNIDIKKLYSTKGKEEKFETPIFIDDYLNLLNSYLGIDVKPKGLIANNCRELMQYYGTEYVRSINDNFWIDSLIEKITNSNNKVIISDLRFDKEYAALKNVGAKIIKIERIGNYSVIDTHCSENELRNIDIDFHLGSVFKGFDYIGFCAKLIANGDFDSLKKYDFRTVVSNFNSIKDLDFDSLKMQMDYYSCVLDIIHSKK